MKGNKNIRHVASENVERPFISPDSLVGVTTAVSSLFGGGDSGQLWHLEATGITMIRIIESGSSGLDYYS